MGMQRDRDKVAGVEMHVDTVKKAEYHHRGLSVYHHLKIGPCLSKKRFSIQEMSCASRLGFREHDSALDSFTDPNQPRQDIKMDYSSQDHGYVSVLFNITEQFSLFVS